jgi:PAS domain S-box-containing protein
MKIFGDERSRLFAAFIKSAQYIVRLQKQQDIWSHLGKFIMTHFPADWTAFVQREAADKICVHHCTLPEGVAAQSILTEEVRRIIAEVLESGFLALHVIPAPARSMTAFLPIVEHGKSEMALLIGHSSGEALSKELLDIYLAIAGLAGSTAERLHTEIELNRHRAHLEELVRERTDELEQAKRHNELILNSVGEGICGLDLEGNITFINPSAARLIGWGPGELTGRNAHAAFHHTRADGCPYPVQDCPVYAALRNETSAYITNEEFVRRDGTRFPVEFMTTSISEAGKVVGAVMVFRDITERKQAEEALQIANQTLQQHAARLEAANQELESFGYSVSHDLRAPLRAIAGFTRMILDEKGATFDAETRRKFGIVQDNAIKMGRLIDDLLRLSRLGRAGMSRSRLDMNNLVGEVLKEVRMAAPEREFAVDIGQLPDAWGDPAMIRQLLANLLSNAVKFTRDNPQACIEVDSFEKCGEQVYYVKDNGVGFDMKYYNKLFGLFQRLVSESQFAGTGVGLTIVAGASRPRIVSGSAPPTWPQRSRPSGKKSSIVIRPKKNSG